ncbi:endoplasmic reticulum resident protein 44-like [Ornithodoros turicata]
MLPTLPFTLRVTLSVVLFLLPWHWTPVAAGGAVALTSSNFDTHIAQHELVFINFYADWCRFSQILGPVFDEAAQKIEEEFKDKSKVLFGKVDCDQETSIASRYRITKYPTLKLVRNGSVLKKEYRGQRSVEAITSHIRDLLKDQVVELKEGTEADQIEEKKLAVVGYFTSKDTTAYEVFRRVASELRDDCKFHFIQREPAPDAPKEVILFKPARAKCGVKDEAYTGNVVSFDDLKSWATDKCIPLVREITFENAEELTEEGLPFLILFHHPDDKDGVEQFTKVVHESLQGDKHSLNFLIADGIKFSHPLHHLGKTGKDLPLIAIDSFRHMYLFPDFKQLTVPGKLKAFVEDLYSGKLHREFHYGPDPTVGVAGGDAETQTTQPPESTFKMLAPSRNRYTLLRDEL